MTMTYAFELPPQLVDHLRRYRARLAASKAGRENYEFAKREQFIRREDRAFYTLASGAPTP